MVMMTTTTTIKIGEMKDDNNEIKSVITWKAMITSWNHKRFINTGI